MKLLLLLLSVSLLPKPDPKLVLIDRQLKNRAVSAEHFSFDQYINRTFPIYTEDISAVIAALEAIAKKMEQKTVCDESDTVNVRHTRFIINTNCHPYRNVSVRMITRLDENNICCSFELIQKEDNYRKIQRALLDLSTYLYENKLED